jgi:2'-5' RNA ligase
VTASSQDETGTRRAAAAGSAGSRRGESLSRPLPTMGMPIQAGLTSDQLTIGVAVEVPDPLGPELQQWRAEFGDPSADLIPAHVTLLPPTAVPADQLADIEAHLSKVAAATAPFELRLFGTDTFRPVSPVVYLRVVDGVEACDDLQRRIRTGPLTRELSFPYHPHVTVAHELDGPALDHAQDTLTQFSAQFRVGSVGLYEQSSGGRWQYRERFAFGVGPA